MPDRTRRESVERLADLDNYEASLKSDGSPAAQTAVNGLQDLKTELTNQVFGPDGLHSGEGETQNK